MIALAPPWTAASQRGTYRHLLEAMARPGTVHDLGEVGGRAALAVLATLCDGASTLHDASGRLAAADRSRLGAQAAAAGEAAFVLADGARFPAGLEPSRGTLLSPEQGATLILDCQAVGEGAALLLQGPGIDGALELRLLGVDPCWWTARSVWCAAFPRGVDLVLCDARRVAALPRSTRIGG